MLTIRRHLVLVAAALTLSPGVTAAAPIVIGGTNLLTPADLAQIETWYGSPIATLTNIFDKVSGDGKTSNSVDGFHASVDGQGPTFTVIRARLTTAPDVPASYQLIGGYNPQSWASSPFFVTTPNDVDRTAFLFNLTQDLFHPQQLTTAPCVIYNCGLYQTINNPFHGPSFGNSPELNVFTSLQGGWVYHYDYGPGDPFFGTNLWGITPGGQTDLVYSDIEVFSFEVGEDFEEAPVPEPSSLLLVGTAGAGLIRRLRIRRLRSGVSSRPSGASI